MTSLLSNQSNSYRSDINGLRALSIIAVLLHHLFPSIFFNGYLGVDVFFFISGFVISSSLYRRNVVNNESLASFYTRRFKRILPPLFFMLLVCSLPTALLIFPSSSSAMLSFRGILASLFGLSNIYYYKQSLDYFGALADLNPFTHTWSLGVEEQFYLILPFIFVYFLRSSLPSCI